jgi:uncharacterized cupredoxin-like copper-binding protein
MLPNPTLRLSLAALALCTTALLAACGDDDDSAEDEGGSFRTTGKAPNDTVKVDMIEFQMTPDKPSVAAGPTKFIATNTSTTMVHELAVLRIKDDGTFENTGEVEDVDPGKSGEIVLDLPAGKYVLACVLVPGEAGSTFDHFKEGMKTDFEVK